jgi:chorismate dehydratase
MEKANITAVSYLNTLPFVFGIKSKLGAAEVNLSLDVPSECARKILAGDVDFGLAPAGILPLIDSAYDHMNYCIAADGEVRTVMLYSKVPLNEISRIQLDVDSRTSVLLVRILSHHYWDIHPVFVDNKNIENVKGAESLLAIGDKAFALRDQFSYAWDLSAEWKKMTGLPFVFAVWVARKGANQETCKAVGEALEYGVAHVDEAIAGIVGNQYADIDVANYLKQRIHFRMNDDFRKGLHTYLSFVAALKKTV